MELSNPRPARVLYLVLWAAMALALGGRAAADSAPLTLDIVPFDGLDEHGTPVRLSDWRGKTVLLTMAYSTCRQVCSYTLHRLEQLQQSADRAGVPVDVLVISYDPAVDSPTSWSMYRQHHRLKRANWHFLTGSSANTERFATTWKFPHWHYDEHIVHDFRILLIKPDGQIGKTLAWETRNEDPFNGATLRCPPASVQGCP